MIVEDVKMNDGMMKGVTSRNLCSARRSWCCGRGVGTKDTILTAERLCRTATTKLLILILIRFQDFVYAVVGLMPKLCVLMMRSAMDTAIDNEEVGASERRCERYQNLWLASELADVTYHPKKFRNAHTQSPFLLSTVSEWGLTRSQLHSSRQRQGDVQYNSCTITQSKIREFVISQKPLLICPIRNLFFDSSQVPIFFIQYVPSTSIRD